MIFLWIRSFFSFFNFLCCFTQWGSWQYICINLTNNKDIEFSLPLFLLFLSFSSVFVTSICVSACFLFGPVLILSCLFLLHLCCSWGHVYFFPSMFSGYIFKILLLGFLCFFVVYCYFWSLCRVYILPVSVQFLHLDQTKHYSLDIKPQIITKLYLCKKLSWNYSWVEAFRFLYWKEVEMFN